VSFSSNRTDATTGSVEIGIDIWEKILNDRPLLSHGRGLIKDVQTAVSSGIGGQNIAENIEGRERYPINVRYQRDFRGFSRC